MTPRTTAPSSPYPIGEIGRKWGETEKREWLRMQSIKRSYRDEVISKFNNLDGNLLVEQYGALSTDPNRYPLFSVRSQTWGPN